MASINAGESDRTVRLVPIGVHENATGGGIGAP